MMIEFDFEFGKREEFDEKKQFVEKKFSDPNSKVKCNVCEKIFQHKLQLWGHRKVHRGKQTCTNCGKEIAGSSSMSNHIKSCKKVQNFKCTICDFKTSRNHSLLDHLRKMHTVALTMGYSCTLCDFKSATKVHLKAHISKDHPKFCCITCGKRFRKADILEKHTLSHEEEVIKKEESDEKMLQRKEERKETYSCLNCDYVATRKHHLKGHQWNNHMREKDVKAKLPKTIARCTKGCGYTSKWGNRNGNIQRHETICQFGGVFVLI